MNKKKKNEKTKIKQHNTIKRIIAILALAVFVILPPTATLTLADPIIDDDMKDHESSGIFESLLSKTILGLANGLISLTGAQDVSVLVYQQPELLDSAVFFSDMTADKSELAYGIFPNNIYKGIETFYKAFNGAIPVPIMVMLAIGGFALLIDVFKGGGERSRIKDILLGLVWSIIALNFGDVLFNLIIGINDALVSGIYQVLIGSGIPVSSFISTIWDSGSTDTIMTGLSSPNLVVAILVLLACVTTFVLNYQYMLRMLTIGALIVLFPIVVVMLVLPSRRGALGQWLQLFVSNVFMQFAHALALGLFFFFLANAEGYEFWLVFVMFFALPSMTDLINRVVGMAFGDGFGGGAGKSAMNISGGTNIMGMAMLARTFMGGSKHSNKENQSTKSLIDNEMASTVLGKDGLTQGANGSAPIATSFNKSDVDAFSDNFSKSDSELYKNGISNNSNSDSALNLANSNVNSPLTQKGAAYAQSQNERLQQLLSQQNKNSNIGTSLDNQHLSSADTILANETAYGSSLSSINTPYNTLNNPLADIDTTTPSLNGVGQNASSPISQQLQQYKDELNQNYEQYKEPTLPYNALPTNSAQFPINQEREQIEGAINKSMPNVHSGNPIHDKLRAYKENLDNNNSKTAVKNPLAEKIKGGLKSVGVTTGEKIAKGSEFMRNNSGIRKAGKLAMVGGGIALGGALSTMATGKGSSGQMVGAVAGVGASKLGGKVFDKSSRATQIGGEIIQSKGQSKGAFDITKQRVGIHSQNQLGNSSEAARIGRELVGGKTGEMLGTGASKAVRKHMEAQQLPQIQQQIQSQQQIVKTAETSYRQAVQERNTIRTPEAQKRVKETHTTLKMEQQKLTQFKGQETQLQTQLSKFYELDSLKNEAKKLAKGRGNSSEVI